MTRWSLKGLAPLVLIIGAACATPGDAERGADATNNDASLAFFSEAYGHINEHYVRQVEMEELVLAGLGALDQIDSTLSIRPQEGQGRIAIFVGEELRGQMPIPRGSNSGAWADFTIDAINAAQQVSPVLQDAPPEQVYETIMDAMVARLDAYSRYSTAEEARNIRAVREGYTGLGISVGEDERGIRVIRVYRNTPAASAGIRRGDLIIAVEGEPVAGENMRAVVRRLQGRVGTTVTISIERDGVPDFDLTVERARVTPIMVDYRREADVAYIAVERFSGRTGERVAAAIRRAQAEIGPGIDGYVLDLRGNPGGLLSQSILISDLFMDGGRIVSTQGRHPDSRQNYFARVGDLTEGAPVVILIDGRSASASEIVAGALQDSGRAIVVGSNSFGKGTVQSEIDLPNQGALSITWSRFHAPSGYALHELGVLPNICTSRAGQSHDSILAALRSGVTTTAGYFERWRTTPIENREERIDLRRTCPAVVESRDRIADPESDRDLRLALRLVRERNLYRAALAATRATVASRPGRQESMRPQRMPFSEGARGDSR